MNIIENEYWSDSRPYYIIYKDKTFLKDMYAQLFVDFPDVGEIAYIGTNTHKLTKDYSFNGEHGNSKDKKKSYKDNSFENDIKKEDRHRAGINVCDTKEESQIREYANIQEIKEMNNMLFYKRLIRDLVNECVSKKCDRLYFISDVVQLYDAYKEDEDIFVKMASSCVWLKRKNIDTTVMNMASVLGSVNMLGYVIKEETVNSPKVVKALAIYI